jgi:hypothetical protein
MAVVFGTILLIALEIGFCIVLKHGFDSVRQKIKHKKEELNHTDKE